MYVCMYTPTLIYIHYVCFEILSRGRSEATVNASDIGSTKFDSAKLLWSCYFCAQGLFCSKGESLAVILFRFFLFFFGCRFHSFLFSLNLYIYLVFYFLVYFMYYVFLFPSLSSFVFLLFRSPLLFFFYFVSFFPFLSFPFVFFSILLFSVISSFSLLFILPYYFIYTRYLRI